MAGSTFPLDDYYHDFWIVKTDANGNMEWNQTYRGETNELPCSLIQTSDGGYGLVGSTFYSSFLTRTVHHYYDVWFVKTDASGNMQWNRTYDGGANEDAFCVIQTFDDGYAIAGYTSSFGAGGEDFWLIKTDDYGNMEWNQTYGGAEADVALSLVQTSDGGYALAGETSSFGAGDKDFWLVKVDSSGNMQGNQTYGGTGEDIAFSLVQTSDGGYAMTGFTVIFDANKKDFWLVKIDEQSVIPEFPSLIIPLLFLTITLLVVALKKRIRYLSAT